MITPEVLMEKLDQFGSGIFQSCIAVIDSFNKTKSTAKVIPLLKRKREKDTVKFPVLSRVPVVTFKAGKIRIIPDFKKGDKVVLLFSTYKISNALKGQHELTEEKFAFENCVVLCGVEDDSFTLSSSSNRDGLTITDNADMYAQFSEDRIELKNKDSKVTLESSGITLDGNVKIKGTLEVDDEITAMNSTLKVKVSRHGHTSPAGPDIPPIIPDLG